MSMGQSVLHGNMAQSFSNNLGNSSTLLDKIKTEMMQVDEDYQHEGGFPRNGEGGGDSRQLRDTPGTPTRGSVITSARELHSTDSSADSQGDNSQVGLVNMASLADRHFASLCSIPSNHKSESMLPLPVSMASSLHVPSSLAMSMDFSAYGGLFHQSLIQREFLSKLGDFTANVKHEVQTQKKDVRCVIWSCLIMKLLNNTGE